DRGLGARRPSRRRDDRSRHADPRRPDASPAAGSRGVREGDRPAQRARHRPRGRFFGGHLPGHALGSRPADRRDSRHDRPPGGPFSRGFGLDRATAPPARRGAPLFRAPLPAALRTKPRRPFPDDARRQDSRLQFGLRPDPRLSLPRRRPQGFRARPLCRAFRPRVLPGPACTPESSRQLRALPEAPGRHAVVEGRLIDITDRKRAEQQRWHQANHDALTDLPNRVLFNDRLSLAILHAHRRRQSLAVMFLDLDHFKRVNDTVGHSAGDELLVKAADRLRRCIRADATVARVGGAEFLLLLNGIARENDAATMARKILEVLSEPFLIQKRELFIEASIGIGLYPGDGQDAEMLVANVDTAMYRAKETGRNTFQFFTRKMQEQSQERAAMESG